MTCTAFLSFPDLLELTAVGMAVVKLFVLALLKYSLALGPGLVLVAGRLDTRSLGLLLLLVSLVTGWIGHQGDFACLSDAVLDGSGGPQSDVGPLAVAVGDSRLAHLADIIARSSLRWSTWVSQPAIILTKYCVLVVQHSMLLMLNKTGLVLFLSLPLALQQLPALFLPFGLQILQFFF